MQSINKNTDSQGLNPLKTAAQFGGGLLSIVAGAGVAMVLMQGTMFYKSKEANKFLNREKAKVLATQISEAGIEETIADIGQRKVVVNETMDHYAVYQSKQFGGGVFSTFLTTVATSAEADTVDLRSHGNIKGGSDQINARLRLRNKIDTNMSITLNSVPITTMNINSSTQTVHDTSTTVMDPHLMPDLDTQPSYAACMSSGAKKCDVCHIPGGNPGNRHVINISKNAIHTHISHHGDYVTTDGSCDLYNPVETITSSTTTVFDTTYVVTNLDVFDTTMVMDTLVKVQVLSWK
jgi:hypothetical protein